MKKTKAVRLDNNDRTDNRTQFVQRRMVEKIQKITQSEGLPKITCVECDEAMLIIGKNQETCLAKCHNCNHTTLIEW